MLLVQPARLFGGIVDVSSVCDSRSSEMIEHQKEVPAPINCIAVGISVVLGFSLAMFCNSKLYTERNYFFFF